MTPSAAPASAHGNAFLRQMATTTALGSPRALQDFTPDKIHRALAGALMAGVLPTSYEDLADHCGFDVRRVRAALRKPGALAWILAEAASCANLGVATVYLRIMREAATSKNPRWADMFLKRFDPAYAQAGAPQVVSQDNRTVNIFGSWTEDELQAFIRDKKQKVLGEQDEPRSP